MVGRTSKVRRGLHFVGSAMLLSACTTADPTVPQMAERVSPTLPHTSIDEDLAEVTFRYQFRHNASGQGSAAHVYCIGYGSDPDRGGGPYDPPSEFLRRLADVAPPVRPYSYCSDRQPGNVVIDPQSGLDALIFRIASVRCDSAARCEVEGGYYESMESSSGNFYALERRNGHWEVVGERLHWIS